MMHASQDAPRADFRVAVLSAHFSGGLAGQQALSCSDCSAPAHARAIAAETRFARPATHETPAVTNKVQPVTVRPRLKGPAYHPTKPGTYQSYTKRASAGPRFARPCEKVEEVTSAVVQPARVHNTPQVNIIDSKAGYQMEMALPGVSAGDVRLELQGNDLVITGKQAMTGTKMKSVRLSPGGKFRAYCKLPNEVDTSSIRADLLNGLLRIRARKQMLH